MAADADRARKIGNDIREERCGCRRLTLLAPDIIEAILDGVVAGGNAAGGKVAVWILVEWDAQRFHFDRRPKSGPKSIAG
jgi:hypothetical protein